jgi:hypothetical protein
MTSTTGYQSILNQSLFDLNAGDLQLSGLTPDSVMIYNSSSQLGTATVTSPLEFKSGALSLNTSTLLSGISTDDLKEGKTNLYYTDARAIAGVASTYEPKIAAASTGPTLKYWRGDKTWRDFQTDARAALSADGVYIQYQSSLGIIDANPTGIRSLFSAASPLSYNSSTGQFSAAAGVYEPAITAGTSTQYWKGDKTWGTLNQAAVAGLTTGDTPQFYGVNISTYTPSSILASDGSKNTVTANTGSSLSFTSNTLNTIQDIRTSASPTFTGLNLSGLTASRLLLIILLMEVRI